tara:strand:- start:375 stop:812 length:438 start_codon:yes stop_codon:yes gene_type:complete
VPVVPVVVPQIPLERLEITHTLSVLSPRVVVVVVVGGVIHTVVPQPVKLVHPVEGVRVEIILPVLELIIIALHRGTLFLFQGIIHMYISIREVTVEAGVDPHWQVVVAVGQVVTGEVRVVLVPVVVIVSEGMVQLELLVLYQELL